jgi:hypothetical protein
MSATIRAGVPFDRYRGAPGLNWSKLKHATTSARHFAAALRGELDGDDTADRGVLRAVHAAVLEPHDFARQFAIWVGRRAGADYQAARAAAPGVTFLATAEAEHVEAVAAAVGHHPEAASLLRLPGFRGEVTVVWAERNITMKGRIDGLARLADRWVLLDLKAVPSIAPRKVAAETARRLYHAQLAHYAAGVAAYEVARGLQPLPVECYLIVYETRPMIDVGVYRLGVAGESEAMFCGAEVRREAIERAAAVMAEADGARLPGQAPEVLDVHLPAWAFGFDDPNEVTND